MTLPGTGSHASPASPPLWDTIVSSPAQPIQAVSAPSAAVLPRYILFSFRSLGYLRFYDSVLRLLAERGHTVHVLADHGEGKREEAANLNAMMALVNRYPSITFAWSPKRVRDRYVRLSIGIRRCLDYLHFLRPQFDAALVLRQRAASRAPRSLLWLGARQSRWRTFIARAMELVLRRIEPATTSPMSLEERIGPRVPDVIVVTPLIVLGSAQFDLLRLARAAGIPTALGVASWDHLSAKVLISTIPDRVFVWNDIQRQEAIRYHRIPSEQVLVTGAQCFDQWFERRSTQSRSDFCRCAGLNDDRPFIFYVCSALFEGSPSEATFVERWVRAIRSSADARLRSTPILIRPHPKRNRDWANVDLSGFDNVVVWPPRGEMPVGADGKSLYFDSLYHSAAVVGLNTSAQIEAGIIGRPVYTVLLPEFYDNQEGTLHFHYLLQVEGGLLHTARSLDDHLTQIADGLNDQASAAARNGRFVKAFIRPRGLDVPATQVFVEELERAAVPAAVVGAAGRRWWIPVVRALLWPLTHKFPDKRLSAAKQWRQGKAPTHVLTDSKLVVVVWHSRWVVRPLARLTRSELRKDRFWNLVKLRVRERAQAAQAKREESVKLTLQQGRLRAQADKRAAHHARKRRQAARALWRARVAGVAGRLRGRRPPSV